MQFITFPFSSNEYQQALTLRHAVLRQPLGLTLSAVDTADDQNQWHFGVMKQYTLIACGIAKPSAQPNTVKLRQMAVSHEYQGLGVGKILMQGLEKHLFSRGIQHIELNARLTAVGFYAKFGYTTQGDIFTEVTIEHIAMVKHLQP